MFPKATATNPSNLTINLQNMMLHGFPPNILDKKVFVKVINAQNNLLTDIPPLLKKFTQLTTLNLTRNQFKTIPLNMNDLSSLETLVYLFAFRDI
jgi:Leucine-rich repeat (LRR) protein